MKLALKAIGAMLDMVPGWIWALACAGLLATNAASLSQNTKLQLAVKHEKALVADQKTKTAEVRSEFDTYKRKQAEQRADDEAAARKRERDLQAQADQMRSQKDAEIKRLRADVRDLRYGLQSLPSRPALSAGGGAGAATSGDTPSGQCGAAVLYREDGELLVDEAERAEEIRIEYLNLFDLYQRARQALSNTDDRRTAPQSN